MLQHRVTAIMDGRITPLGFEPPAFTSANTPWAGFLLEGHIVKASRHEIGWAWHNTHVGICTGGTSVMRVSGAAGNVRYITRPGTVCVFPSGCDHTNIYHQGAGHQFLVAELDGSCLERLLHGGELPTSKPLLPQVGIEDPQVVALMTAMRMEIEAGCPAGALYAESLSLALATHLLGRYSARESVSHGTDLKLSPTQVQRVIDYIHAHLGSDFSLVQLANVVHLSPRHFTRLFRNTFGTTPYRFVVNERVNHAKALLAAQRLSIVEIAETLGFASQSHFTDVFRKATGVSPRRYRQDY